MPIPLLYLLPLPLLLLAYTLRNAGRRPADFPPGPPTLPFIGNLHQMPKEKPHLQFKKWAEEYGPVFSLMMGPSSVMIVLTSDEAVKDLLDKKSTIYSDRPSLYVGNLLSGGLRMLFMRYGDRWRMIRKTVHNQLNIKAAKSYIPYQDLENRQLLVGLLERPDRWEDNLRRYTNALTMQMLFGFRTTSIDDQKMHKLFRCIAGLSELTTSPEAQIIDVFPWLSYLPETLLPVKRKAREHHEGERGLYVGHWLDVKKRIQNQTANPCICVDLANSQNKEGFDDPTAAYIACSLLEAGSDTTYSTLVGFVQAMLLHPDVAVTARAHLDRVCGDRLPTLEDENDLQYIRSCVKESMRWMPTAILGIPHAAVREDMYKGWRIPKGAMVIYNVWGIHNDSTRFPNPRAFDPMRYASDFQSASEAATNGDPTKRDHFLFGAGRRICQGMHIAERSLFLAISRMLWAFDIEKVKDQQGNAIVPDAAELQEGLLVLPKKFPARITPRSAERAEAVRKEWDLVRDKLDAEGQWKSVPEGMYSKEYVPLTG